MFKLILTYLKGPARLYAIVAPLMMLLEVFMDLQQPVLMARIIDVGVARQDMAYVLQTGLHMLVLATIGLVGGAGCSIFAAMAAVGLSGELRQGLFAKVQTLSFGEIDHLTTASLITRLTNDVMQVQHMMLMMLRVMVRAPFLFLGSIVMAFLLSPRLSLIFAAILPLIAVSIVLIVRHSVPLFSAVQKRLDRVNTVMRENLLGIRVVKSFNLETAQTERFDAVNDELTTQSIRAQNITFLLMPVVTLVMNLSVVAVLWFGGRLFRQDQLELGKIMAFINYLVQITSSLLIVVNLMINISRAQASTARINEVLAMQPTIREPAEPRPMPEPRQPGPAIEFRNVCFRYGTSGDLVLKDLSLQIAAGQMIGIIGATGSGKSTLISLIPRLYDGVAGQILIHGVDVRQLSLATLRRKIGLVMQDSLLFSGTIRSNLQFGDAEAADARLDHACQDAQALDFIQARPHGYDAIVEQRGRNFSGGQKQRLSIARTLLLEPDILILDDSTSAVDMITESRLRSALTHRLQGRTIIIIAQRISAVRQADRIFVLDQGAITAAGTHEELLASSEIYRSIAVTQLGEDVVTTRRDNHRTRQTQPGEDRTGPVQDQGHGTPGQPGEDQE